jgi:hypothetical protein
VTFVVPAPDITPPVQVRRLETWRVSVPPTLPAETLMVAGEIASPLLKLNAAPAAVSVATDAGHGRRGLNWIVAPASPFVSVVAA